MGLREAAESEGQSGFEPGLHGLRKLLNADKHGFVWVWMGSRAVSEGWCDTFRSVDCRTLQVCQSPWSEHVTSYQRVAWESGANLM